jgi:hypothetical protein
VGLLRRTGDPLRSYRQEPFLGVLQEVCSALIPGTFRRLLLACAIWIGFIPLIPQFEQVIFDAELNMAQGDFIVRYTRVTQHFFMEQLGVSILIVGAGVWISVRLLPAYWKKIVTSVLLGSFLTAESIFNVSHVLEPSYEAYLRGFPLSWLSYSNSVGTLNMWMLEVNAFLIVNVLFWACISYLAMSVALKLSRAQVRSCGRKANRKMRSPGLQVSISSTLVEP